MEIKFNCSNQNCGKNDEKPYEMVIRSEAILDEKNIAAIFCPRCKKPLKRSKSQS